WEVAPSWEVEPSWEAAPSWDGGAWLDASPAPEQPARARVADKASAGTAAVRMVMKFSPASVRRHAQLQWARRSVGPAWRTAGHRTPLGSGRGWADRPRGLTRRAKSRHHPSPATDAEDFQTWRPWRGAEHGPPDRTRAHRRRKPAPQAPR